MTNPYGDMSRTRLDRTGDRDDHTVTRGELDALRNQPPPIPTPARRTIAEAVEDEDRAWVLDAACRPELRPDGETQAEWTARFFPDRGQGIDWVRAICRTCPVRADCLEAHLTETHGWYGGLSPKARRAERVRRNGKGLTTPGDVQRAEVTRLCDLGLTDTQVAERMGLNVHTVRYHRINAGWARTRTGQLVRRTNAA